MTESEFNDIFNTHWVRIVMYIKNQLNDNNLFEAKDISIQVFYNLWKAQPVFINDTAVKSWLYIAAKRRCINFSKRDRTKKEIYTDCLPEYSLTENDHSDIVLFEIKSELLENIYKSKYLSKKERLVFNMYYLKQLTPREIATGSKVTLSTINSQLNQLHNKLKHLFKNKKPWF